MVLVTGLSGAGKASILRVLEDLGFETVDNPPLTVLEELVEDGDASRSPPASTPAPAASMPPPVLDTLARLRRNPRLRVRPGLAWADEGVLLRRYTETRRRHPLARRKAG